MPAEPVDVPGPVLDQVFSVVDEQTELPGGAVELGDGQVGLAQRGTGDGERVDGVGLAVGAGRVPGLGHQLRRHSPDPLTGGEQIGLEAPGQMPAVLHRPLPLGAEPFGPAHQLEMISRRGRLRRLRRELAAPLVDDHHRVGALVRVDPEDHHVPVAFLDVEVTTGPVGGHTSVGAMPRSYQATPAGPACPRGGTHDEWPRRAATFRANPPDTDQPDTEERCGATRAALAGERGMGRGRGGRAAGPTRAGHGWRWWWWAQDALPSPQAVGHDRNPCERSARDGAGGGGRRMRSRVRTGSGTTGIRVSGAPWMARSEPKMRSEPKIGSRPMSDGEPHEQPEIVRPGELAGADGESGETRQRRRRR